MSEFTFLRSFGAALLLSLCSLACGSDDDKGDGDGAGGTTSGGPPGISGGFNVGGEGNGTAGGAGGGGGGLTIDPTGFTPADIGGYKLGEPLDGGEVGTTPDGCGQFIIGVVRDFKGKDDEGGHPDFEAFDGDEATPNLVAAQLGDDRKPVYSSKCEADDTNDNKEKTADCPWEQQTTSKERFDQWYRATANVNKPYLVYFQFEPRDGTYTFESRKFFPLDNAGWGNSGEHSDGTPHNFGFTTEVHTQFTYNGGEQFRFKGDDDVWVFINKKLALDLGGLHPQLDATISLDEQATALGLEKGKIYDLELFHAERHTRNSNFRIDTNLAFVNCGTVPPDEPE